MRYLAPPCVYMGLRVPERHPLADPHGNGDGYGDRDLVGITLFMTLDPHKGEYTVLTGPG